MCISCPPGSPKLPSQPRQSHLDKEDFFLLSSQIKGQCGILEVVETRDGKFRWALSSPLLSYRHCGPRLLTEYLLLSPLKGKEKWQVILFKQLMGVFPSIPRLSYPLIFFLLLDGGSLDWNSWWVWGEGEGEGGSFLTKLGSILLPRVNQLTLMAWTLQRKWFQSTTTTSISMMKTLEMFNWNRIIEVKIDWRREQLGGEDVPWNDYHHKIGATTHKKTWTFPAWKLNVIVLANTSGCFSYGTDLTSEHLRKCVFFLFFQVVSHGRDFGFKVDFELKWRGEKSSKITFVPPCTVHMDA